MSSSLDEVKQTEADLFLHKITAEELPELNDLTLNHNYAGLSTPPPPTSHRDWTVFHRPVSVKDTQVFLRTFRCESCRRLTATQTLSVSYFTVM